MEEFNTQVVDSMFQDIYPPETWDSLFCIKGIQGEPNYQHCQDYIRNVQLNFEGKIEGHPLLIQQDHFDCTPLDETYKKELESIKVMYIYEDLDKGKELEIQQYFALLKSR